MAPGPLVSCGLERPLCCLVSSCWGVDSPRGWNIAVNSWLGLCVCNVAASVCERWRGAWFPGTLCRRCVRVRDCVGRARGARCHVGHAPHRPCGVSLRGYISISTCHYMHCLPQCHASHSATHCRQCSPFQQALLKLFHSVVACRALAPLCCKKMARHSAHTRTTERSITEAFGAAGIPPAQTLAITRQQAGPPSPGESSRSKQTHGAVLETAHTGRWRPPGTHHSRPARGRAGTTSPLRRRPQPPRSHGSIPRAMWFTLALLPPNCHSASLSLIIPFSPCRDIGLPRPAHRAGRVAQQEHNNRAGSSDATCRGQLPSGNSMPWNGVPRHRPSVYRCSSAGRLRAPQPPGRQHTAQPRIKGCRRCRGTRRHTASTDMRALHPA